MASFLILGPVEAWGGERRLTLGGPRQLALFAFLLLYANRAVSSDMLIDAVWGTTRPGADTRLRMAITRLRQALEPLGDDEPRLRTVGGGYLLSISSGELDADVCLARLQDGQRLLKAGDPGRAVELLRSALVLWRGPPLAEVAFHDFAQAEIRRLEELRLVALESQIDARLQLGEHAQLASELEGLTIEHPLRERLAGQLMLALYRCSRQADALDVYQRTRTQLAQELGLEPGPLLKELQRKVLDQSPSLVETSVDQTAADPPPQTQAVDYEIPAALLAASRGSFVGRQTELDRLIRLWRRSIEGVRQAVLVAGEPGIGKTTLLAHFAAEVVARRGLVLYGRCDEELSIPYQPIVESFRTYLQYDAHAVLTSGPFSGELARILPELRQFELAQPLSAQERDADTSRSLLFHGVIQVFRRLGALSPLLVLLEDLHWADPSTLQLLRAILRAAEPANIFVVATYRDDDPKQVEAVERALLDPGHLVDVTHLQLSGLTEVDIRTLLAERSADSAGPLADAASALHAYTLGNPLFVSQLVVDSDAGVPDRLSLSSGEPGSPNLSRELRVIVRRRTASLGSKVQDLLTAGAVLGSRWPLRLLQEVTDTSSPRDWLLDALDLAVSAGVLTEEQPGSFTFTHELIRDALVAELAPAQRMRLHLAVADAIERSFDIDDMLGDLSFHLRMAAPLGHGAKAAHCTLRSAAQEFQQAAFEMARIHLSDALNALDIDKTSERPLKCELLLAIGGAAAAGGDNNGNRESCLQAATVARAAQSWEHLGLAAVQAAASGVFGTADSSVLNLCREAMKKADAMSPALRAQVIGVTAYYRSTFEGANCEHDELSSQALELARCTGDHSVFAFVGFLRFWTLYSLERVSESVALADELVDKTTEAPADAPTDGRVATRASPYWGRSYALRCRVAGALKRGARDRFDWDVSALEDLAGAPVSLVALLAKSRSWAQTGTS